jgi:thiamine pyridinylase
MRQIAAFALLCTTGFACDRSAGTPSARAVPAASAAPVASATAPSAAERRKLTVALYPYVPNNDGMFREAKVAFEQTHPDVEVVAVALDSYYDSTQDGSVMGKTGATANVIEFDSVFRDDLMAAKRLSALPAGSEPQEQDFTSAAAKAARVDGQWIGVPHWVCSDFVYTTKAKPFSGRSLKDLERFVGLPHPAGAGLLTDMVGKSSIGELYLDALIDEIGSLEAALAQLASTLPTDGGPPPAQAAEKRDLQRLLALCDGKFCRDKGYHKDPSGYAREFAQKHGSALIGYSEATYDIVNMLAKPECSAPGSCLRLEDVVVSTFPLADEGAHPFVWVDTLAIQASCVGSCVADAAAFIAAMNDDAHLKADLFPTGDAPRYLLPAKTTLDADLRTRAPLYARFRALTEGAPPATGKKLGDSLRGIGGTLDTDGTLKH